MSREDPDQTETRGTILLVGIIGVCSTVVGYVLHLRRAPDMDLWLHLAIGREIRAGERFQRLPDPLTALADRPYLPSQWASELGLDRLWALGGLAAVEVARLVLVLALVGFLLAATTTTAQPAAAGVAVTLSTFVTAAAWAERPQLLAMVLLAVTSWGWWLARVRQIAPWWLVPIAWIWACTHGTWPIGIVIGAGHILALLLDGHGQVARRWIWVPMVTIVVSAATPLGPRLLSNPMTVTASAREVSEWQRPSIVNPLLIILVIACLFTAWVEIRRRAAGWRGRLLLTALAVVLGCSAVRTLVIGGILMAPLLAAALDSAWRAQPVPRPNLRRWAWSVATVLVFAQGTWTAVGRTPPLMATTPDTALVSLPSGTRVIASPELTGWVLWRAPHLTLLRDLRAEVYSEHAAAPYEDFLQARPGWQQYAAEHQIEAALLADDADLTKAVRGAGWRAAGTAPGSTLWISPYRR